MEQLLNGRFEYEVPHLLLSETEVALTLDAGQNFRGELNIGAEDGRRVKGIVTTDHQRIVLAKNQFQGTASTIEYGVDTSGLKAGDEICGNITVSSNLEERCVRVHVSIAGKTMNISGQEIHSLADFVHLASHDFGAAYRFFVKKEFARLLQKEARRTRKKKETVLRLMCGTKSCRCPSALSARSTESSAEAATAYG